MTLKLLTIREAAGQLKVHPTTLLRAIAAKKLEAVQMGKEYRVSEKALEQYIEAMTINKKTGERNDASNNGTKAGA